MPCTHCTCAQCRTFEDVSNAKKGKHPPHERLFKVCRVVHAGRIMCGRKLYSYGEMSSGFCVLCAR